jgi:hypothetical protein
MRLMAGANSSMSSGGGRRGVIGAATPTDDLSCLAGALRIVDNDDTRSLSTLQAPQIVISIGM